ncbi:MAG: magnesium/cobalt efflux protein [Gammaproteobacteria bacterium RIFCSPHIGHO2_12_FULL_37_34]|nr:MAG: magnesium/cobalt efflux protein [Gammaproteobacteria bacterium RIFCSPHIGHO2_12_FULL_37_34]
MNDALKNTNNPVKSRSWLERLTALLVREPKNREQLTEILRDAEERNVLSADILSMIERILLVSEMQVREVMIPKTQMVVVRKDSKFEKILPIVIESGHSRFPVVDASLKDVVGMLLAKDLLKYGFQQEPQSFSMNTMIRPVIFVPQSKRLDILLREFRVNRNHIAIVIDEYGHVAGLVTIEDVLEQIVGDIEDEYDIDEENGHIKKLDDGVCIVKTSTSIEEFNNYFHSDFSHDEFDTIGGIVLQSFGHLPKRGEITKIQTFRFKVLHADNRRIYLVEVKVGKGKKRD